MRAQLPATKKTNIRVLLLFEWPKKELKPKKLRWLLRLGEAELHLVDIPEAVPLMEALGSSWAPLLTKSGLAELAVG